MPSEIKSSTMTVLEGDKDKAIELLKKSLEIEPNKIESKRALERIQNQ